MALLKGLFNFNKKVLTVSVRSPILESTNLNPHKYDREK